MYHARCSRLQTTQAKNIALKYFIKWRTIKHRFSACQILRRCKLQLTAKDRAIPASAIGYRTKTNTQSSSETGANPQLEVSETEVRPEQEESKGKTSDESGTNWQEQ